MIAHWLKEVPRANNYKFQVIDITERDGQPDLKVTQFIARELLLGRRFIEELRKFKNKPETELEDYINNKTFADPATPFNIRKGDWGEILTATILQHLRQAILPIKKLRYKTDRNKSMFLIDVVAIKFTNNKLIIIFAEAKTYSTYNKTIGEDAYNELAKDGGKHQPQIIDFISQRLVLDDEFDMADKIDIIYNKPKSYSRDFQIFLIVDKSIWRETILQHLNTVVKLQPLMTNIVFVQDLDKLIESTYSLTIDEGKKILNE